MGSNPTSSAFASLKLGFGGHSPQEDERRREEIFFMYYVYTLKCVDKHLYTGCAENIEERLNRHNSGHVPATAGRLTVELITYTIFKNKHKAFDFEKYLKSGSGRAFMNKHLIDNNL